MRIFGKVLNSKKKLFFPWEKIAENCVEFFHSLKKERKKISSLNFWSLEKERCPFPIRQNFWVVFFKQSLWEILKFFLKIQRAVFLTLFLWEFWINLLSESWTRLLIQISEIHFFRGCYKLKKSILHLKIRNNFVWINSWSLK